MVTITVNEITVEAESMPAARAALRKAQRERERLDKQARENYANAIAAAKDNLLAMFQAHFDGVVKHTWEVGDPGKLSCLELRDGQAIAHQSLGYCELRDRTVTAAIESHRGVVALYCQPVNDRPHYIALGLCNGEECFLAIPDEVGARVFQLVADHNAQFPNNPGK